MPRMRSLVVIALCLLSVNIAVAQKRKPTGRRWSDMDYGPYMSHSFEAAAPSGNIANKGIKVRLADGATMVFDTDLLRFSSGFLAGGIDWRSVVYDGSHGTHPRMVGRQVFGNPMRPGWKVGGSFKDPRKLPHGPLPSSSARYLGLYLNGQKVVLAYRIGSTKILDLAGVERIDGQQYLTRTIQVAPGKQTLILQAIHTNGQAAKLVSDSGGKIAAFGVVEQQSAKKAKKPRTIPGLLAHWKFDASDKGRVKNEAGNQFIASIQRAKLVTGTKGKALNLTGREVIEIAQSKQLEFGRRDFTISAWIKTTAKRGTIIAKNQPNGPWARKGKCFFVRGRRLGYDVGWLGKVESRRVVADGRWHHVAVSYNHRSGATKLYVDGKADGSRNLRSLDDSKHIVRIGYTGKTFMPPFRGQMDDFRIYGRGLAASEIAQLAGTTFAPRVTAVAVTAGSGWKYDLDNKGNVRIQIAPRDKPVLLKLAFFRGDQKGSKGKPGLAGFVSASKSIAKPTQLSKLTKGGPARWNQVVKTKGRLSKGSKQAYVSDVLTLPNKNPWNAWMRLGGFDFFTGDKRAAVCTWNGDVWIVDGVDGDLSDLRWRRIATGMFQPLGLKIVQGQIFVCCRDQITRLHDLNGDGETDFYESFNHDHQVTTHFHEFAMDLQVDKQGNFFYAKSARHALDSVVPHHGTLIKVSPDGKRSDIYCNGFRAANGVGISPKGEIATSDQEGHWTPANRINLVKKDGFYGNMYSFHRGKRPKSYDPPLVWLPKNVDRSPASQLWVNSKKWGPLAGKMLSTSYGVGRVWHVMYERVNGVAQGGVVQLPLQFPTGIMRARFHKQNGQLYLCGLVGWSSNLAQGGGFYRVRYTGRPLHLPVGLRVRKEGVELTFSEAIDEDSATDIDNYSIEQWNYRWSANYGSPHFKVSNSKQLGHDEVEVEDVQVTNKGKTLLIELEEVRPVMQMLVSYTLKTASGVNLRNRVWLTINRVPK